MPSYQVYDESDEQPEIKVVENDLGILEFLKSCGPRAILIMQSTSNIMIKLYKVNVRPAKLCFSIGDAITSQANDSYSRFDFIGSSLHRGDFVTECYYPDEENILYVSSNSPTI